MSMFSRVAPRYLSRMARRPILYASRRGESRVINRISDQRPIIEVISVVHRRNAYHS